MPPTQQSIAGTEFSWLAVDDVGHVGLFTTSGEGPVPNSALSQSDQNFEVEEAILELSERSGCKLHVRYPRPDDYVSVAKRGVYAFDWTDIHQTQSRCTHRYSLVGEPELPLMVSDLPLPLQARARSTTLSGIVFGGSVESGVTI
jgi:hypothetical protein